LKTILQINIVVNFGSTGHIAEELGKTAMANGWESHIAYGRNERSSESGLIKIGSDYEVNWHVLQTRLIDRHGLGSKRATLKFVEQIKKLKPDIIHLHNIHGYYINIEVLFNYLATANIPVVWTLHDCWPLTGHCAHFDFVGCDKWKTGCFSCPQTKEYPASFAFDRSKKNHLLKKDLFTSINKLTFVPVSQWLSNIVNQSFLKNYPFQVINNGIDIDVFVPYKDDLISDKYNIKGKFVVLGVANVWSARKGLSDFIELSRIIDSNCRIILIGLTTKQIKDLPQNIIGLSRTESTKELAEFYSYADVFLNPTWEDNFPTTNLESLACGTPVITYRTGGSAEAISTETGLIVEKGDIQGLSNAVKIINEKGKRSFSIACRERAEKLYDKRERYQEYINLYDKVLSIE